MPRILFIEARFFDPDETHRALEIRFEQYLLTLRGRMRRAETHSVAGPQPLTTSPYSPALTLSEKDQSKIHYRVKAIVESRRTASGLGHLKPEDQECLEVLRHGARLIAIPTEHRADELASALHGDLPWMGAATEIVWRAMRHSVLEGRGGLRLPALLLDGPPGIGKSYWARRLGELLFNPGCRCRGHWRECLLRDSRRSARLERGLS